MAKITFSVEDKIFPSKDINHVIRYCSELNYILDNINLGGFHPSYCQEKFNEENLLIPMVSFCNIPISDIENYMYYGDYGIGFTMEWALKNKLSPVIYVHENSDFVKLPFVANTTMLQIWASFCFQNEIEKNLTEKSGSNNFENKDNFIEYLWSKTIDLNQETIKFKQFAKFWKSEVEFEIDFKELDCKTKITKTINSYNEREWRYVPIFENNEFEKFINKYDEKGILNTKYSNFIEKEKPHITEEKYNLKFDLNDIKYIIVRKSSEIKKIVEVLVKKYNEVEVTENLTNGKLNIISREVIRNDF